MALYEQTGDGGGGFRRKRRMYDPPDLENPANDTAARGRMGQPFRRPPAPPGVSADTEGRPEETSPLARRRSGAQRTIDEMSGSSFAGAGSPAVPGSGDDRNTKELTHATPEQKAIYDEGTGADRPQSTKPPGTRPLQSDRDVMARTEQLRQTIRSRGPQIEDLVARRRAETDNRFQKFGQTPTGGDENAPKPRIRPGRRAYNPFRGNYS